MIRNSAKDPNIKRYLHRKAIPLRDIDFNKLLKNKKVDNQLNLFENECEGMCGV